MGEYMNDLDFDSWLDGNSWTNLNNEFYGNTLAEESNIIFYFPTNV